jgi:hypothetical protein
VGAQNDAIFIINKPPRPSADDINPNQDVDVIAKVYLPDEANARLIAAAPDLVDLVEAYEAWEGDLILSDEAWDGGMAPLPRLTQELWDRLLEIQAMRNAVSKKITGKDSADV